MKKVSAIVHWVYGTVYLIGTFWCVISFIHSKEWSALMWLGVAQIFLVDLITLDSRYKNWLKRQRKLYELATRIIIENKTFQSRNEDQDSIMNEKSEKKPTVQ
ncbi:MAG: hypothetical protein KGI50_06285 [Patescibacteria group bacterium]|nr:hypothetical protein [Patescibacteria group bacterium]MDE2438930.1 hypothetical protein [Patescibacteria group bacterium]